jgi:hypothetical protein
LQQSRRAAVLGQGQRDLAWLRNERTLLWRCLLRAQAKRARSQQANKGCQHDGTKCFSGSVHIFRQCTILGAFQGLKPHVHLAVFWHD